MIDYNLLIVTFGMLIGTIIGTIIGIKLFKLNRQ